MKAVFVCVLAALIVCAQAHVNFAEAEYNDGATHEMGHLMRPTVEAIHHESMPMPSVPEPLAAEEPKKSLVQEVTGINDADEMRFAEVEESASAHVAAPTMSATSDDEDKASKLKTALESVKAEIVHLAKAIKSEKAWVKQVTAIIESYVHKTRRVNADVRAKQRQVRDLFKKKKQIDNLILQERLLKKLNVANKDLVTIGSALGNVKKKEEAFSKSKNSIAGTIGAIQAELKKLRGEKGARKAAKKAKKKAKKAAKKAEKKALKK
jgi:hypothetical protein